MKVWCKTMPFHLAGPDCLIFSQEGFPLKVGLQHLPSLSFRFFFDENLRGNFLTQNENMF